jgi:uncharacterized protein YabN with tetrapyrrole methylase and pyrophosphatase domain
MLLHAALDRFERRFREMEAEIENRGKVPADMAPAELEASWQRAKRAESAIAPVSTTTARRERTKDP